MRISILIFCCCFQTILWSQNPFEKKLYVIDSTINTFNFKLDVSNGKLGLDKQMALKPTGKYPGVKAINLQNGDLVLEYDYQGKSKKFNTGIIEILEIRTLVDSNKVYQIDQFSKNNTDEKAAGTRMWTDAMENVLDTDIEYQMTIKRRYYDIVDLSKGEPNFKKGWIPLAIVGLGGATLGVGQIFKNQQKNAYADYQQLWQNGNPQSDAQNLYDESKKHYDTSKLLHQIGWGILIADALYTAWWVRDVRYKRKIYRQYKNGDVGHWQVSPYFDFQKVNEQEWATLGAQFQLQF